MDEQRSVFLKETVGKISNSDVVEIRQDEEGRFHLARLKVFSQGCVMWMSCGSESQQSRLGQEAFGENLAIIPSAIGFRSVEQSLDHPASCSTNHLRHHGAVHRRR